MGLMSKEVDLHLWPEWIEFMERLVHHNYFDRKRKDEDKMIQDLGFKMDQVVDQSFDFVRDWRTVNTACPIFSGRCRDRKSKFWLVMDVLAQTRRLFFLRNC